MFSKDASTSKPWNLGNHCCYPKQTKLTFTKKGATFQESSRNVLMLDLLRSIKANHDGYSSPLQIIKSGIYQVDVKHHVEHTRTTAGLKFYVVVLFFSRQYPCNCCYWLPEFTWSRLSITQRNWDWSGRTEVVRYRADLICELYIIESNSLITHLLVHDSRRRLNLEKKKEMPLKRPLVFHC